MKKKNNYLSSYNNISVSFSNLDGMANRTNSKSEIEVSEDGTTAVKQSGILFLFINKKWIIFLSCTVLSYLVLSCLNCISPTKKINRFYSGIIPENCIYYFILLLRFCIICLVPHHFFIYFFFLLLLLFIFIRFPFFLF